MAVVTWNRGPWATKPSAPYQSLTTAPQGASRPIDASARPNEAYASLLVPPMESGKNSGVSSRGEPRGFGDAPSLSNAMGGGWSGRLGASLASHAADLGLSLATGLAPSPIGGPMATYGIMSALNNAIRGWAGAPSFEANPWGGVPTEAEIAQARDLNPNAVAGMMADRATREASMRETGMEDVSERFGGISPSGDYGGTTGSDGSRGGGSMGGGGGESSGTGAAGGMGGADTSGSGHGGPGGDTYAKGGVSRATSGPKRATFGEAGPERAIFIPEQMHRPGMQGNERQVRRGLRSAYHSLMPRGPMAPGGR